MIIYSKLEINRIKDFWELLNRLDTETDYMMYEPNERKAKTTVQELKLDIQDNVIQGFDFLQVATENDKIVGYIRAERGKFERNFHTAYIVIGILKKYRGKGIGTTFFNNLDLWAKTNNIVRLELTVECYKKLDIENPIIRINTAFKGCSSLEKISVLPRIYHN